MLLLLNKTIKPLSQFAKKNPKEVSVFGATGDAFLNIFDKIFSQGWDLQLWSHIILRSKITHFPKMILFSEKPLI